MNTIGDFLADEIKENAARKGAVYRMKLTPEEGVSPKNEGDKDRNKYFVVMGHDKEGHAIGFVLINSKINQSLPEHLRLLHYPIKSNYYKFLSHNSFIDCSRLHTIHKDKFHSQNCIPLGNINEEDLLLVTNTLVNSPLITLHELSKFNLSS